MADHYESRTFLLPVYKSDASGDIIEAGDTLKALIYSDDGIWKNQDLVVAAVSEDGRTVYWECDSTNLFKRSSDVAAVHADHLWNCPAAVNLRLLAYAEGDNTVDAFTVGSTVTTGDWDPAVSGDEVLLEDAINAVLIGNGHATVTTDGTAFSLWVMNTTYDVSVTNVVTATPLAAF